MEKVKINYFVDIFMGISFVVSAITGLIIFFFIPSGVKHGSLQEFLGFEKYIWTNIHNWSGLLMILLVLLHLILHWNWIVCITKTFFVKKEQEECKLEKVGQKASKRKK
jgi:hypothetical protein